MDVKMLQGVLGKIMLVWLAILLTQEEIIAQPDSIGIHRPAADLVTVKTPLLIPTTPPLLAVRAEEHGMPLRVFAKCPIW